MCVHRDGREQNPSAEQARGDLRASANAIVTLDTGFALLPSSLLKQATELSQARCPAADVTQMARRQPSSEH
jgi:hypothetical protein